MFPRASGTEIIEYRKPPAGTIPHIHNFSRNTKFYRLIGDATSPTNIPEMTPLAASGTHLSNFEK